MFGNTKRRQQIKEDKQEFGRGGSATRYKMKERMFSIGDDFWIENEQGQRAYKVNGKLLALADSLDFEDPHGKVLVKLRGKVITIRGQIKLDRPGGKDAVIKKDLINIVRDHLSMTIDGEPIEPGADDVLFLAATVAVDQLCHDIK